jgi:hypothetical protein
VNTTDSSISLTGNLTRWSTDCNCYFPSYIAYFVVLMFFAITLSAYLPLWIKCLAMVTLFAIQTSIYMFTSLGSLLDAERLLIPIEESATM